VLDECTHKKNGVRDDWRHWVKRIELSSRRGSDSRRGTYNRGLDFGSTVNEHAHPMLGGLVARTVVGQDERKIYRMLVCVRDEVPRLLRPIVDLVGAGADAAELNENGQWKC
jgi:hypothetical protein